MDYLNSLNSKQREAVEHAEGPVLILAGAGSGKTRVLVHRMAHLIAHHRVHPSEIFAVTFTNKAAAEMRHRVFSLMNQIKATGASGSFGLTERGLWVSTFHSSCVRILRSDIHHLGYQKQFTIYDDSDQLSVVKACLKELNVSDGAFSPKALQGRINRLKNDGIDASTYEPAFGGPFEDIFIRVFERYTEVLKRSSAVDFADLILLTVKLFQGFPRVLENYQDRFPFLMIDEYQDTNKCQYLLMKLLAKKYQNICAVGDEDQSIYRWRGADITNILNFEKDFPNASIFKLEENYRSTKSIIEAASRVIAYNTERRDKVLWTANDVGEKIEVVEAYDEHDEALKVASELVNCIAQGYPLNQIAVFYRTNAQSRLLEDMLRAKGINYLIYGGLKFYDRLEVKDTLAYLKLIANPADDVSFRRVINVPARGIGAVSLEKFADKARELGISHYQLLTELFGNPPTLDFDLGRSAKNFRKFYDILENLKLSSSVLLPSDLVNQVLEDSGYRKMLLDENTVESQSRLENLAELRQGIVEYELRRSGETPDGETPAGATLERAVSLEGFLEEIALVSDFDRFDPNAPALKMMTIHMAKGLEFDLVFIVGLEEELFPSLRPWEVEEAASVEEERRLFYVGMTRARKKLYLLYAKNRTVFGTSHFRVMSRFVEEIPLEYLNERKADYFSRRRQSIDKPGLFPRLPNADGFSQVAPASFDEFSQEEFTEGAANLPPSKLWRTGSKVVHPLFGEGIVRQSLGKDKLLVEFAGRGVKKISLRFSHLKTE